MPEFVPVPDSTARSDREREFHDASYASDRRAHLHRYYTGALGGLREYHAALDSAVGAARPGARVLEYGCGEGSSAFDLAAAGYEVLGIDISSIAIEKAEVEAQARKASGASFRVMDAQKLDLDDESFDVVCGTAILHHLDLETALGEVARVLRPDGCAVFYEPLGHNPLVALYRRATPGLRTADERPLRWADLEGARRWFGSVETEVFNLVALALAPIADRPAAIRCATSLHRVDQALFRRVPFLRRYAWTALIQLGAPHPQRPR